MENETKPIIPLEFKFTTLQELQELKEILDKQFAVPIYILEEKHLSSGEVKVRGYQFNPEKFIRRFTNA